MLRRRLGSPEIPTSSMADVAMLLVAFFALTAAFTQTAGLPAGFDGDVDRPANPEAAQGIELRLDASGRAWLVDRALPAGDLEEPLWRGLAPLLAVSPQRPVHVSTHPEAPLGRFVELQDALVRCSRRLAASETMEGRRLRIVVPTLAQEARLGRRER